MLSVGSPLIINYFRAPFFPHMSLFLCLSWFLNVFLPGGLRKSNVSCRLARTPRRCRICFPGFAYRDRTRALNGSSSTWLRPTSFHVAAFVTLCECFRRSPVLQGPVLAAHSTPFAITLRLPEWHDHVYFEYVLCLMVTTELHATLRYCALVFL